MGGCEVGGREEGGWMWGVRWVGGHEGGWT